MQFPIPHPGGRGEYQVYVEVEEYQVGKNIMLERVQRDGEGKVWEAISLLPLPLISS